VGQAIGDVPPLVVGNNEASMSVPLLVVAVKLIGDAIGGLSS
jgi:hypothetical protein